MNTQTPETEDEIEKAVMTAIAPDRIPQPEKPATPLAWAEMELARILWDHQVHPAAQIKMRRIIEHLCTLAR